MLPTCNQKTQGYLDFKGNPGESKGPPQKSVEEGEREGRGSNSGEAPESGKGRDGKLCPEEGPKHAYSEVYAQDAIERDHSVQLSLG